MDFDDLPETLREFGSIAIIILALLTFDFFNTNPNYFWIVLAVVIIGSGIYFYYKNIQPYRNRKTTKINKKDKSNTLTSERIGKRITNEFVNELRILLSAFRPVPQKKYNESAFEAQLYQTLNQAYKTRNIAYQSSAKSGRVDLVIDNRWAIELKLASSKKQLDIAFRQFLKYAEEFEYLFVLVHDTNKKLQKSDITGLSNDFKKIGLTNIEFIIVNW
ncbi:hypothetical protein HOB30_00440 [Candidatus Falkowbacteria bacterium]|jgi:hypothetical protein|nr:hypothetical protein [Candidatus Falkowbacteria bacterium]